MSVVFCCQDFNEKPANMCLLHNTVKENQPANTTVGQILIEDPDHPYLTCSHGSTGQTVSHQADYSCQVVKGDDEFNSVVESMFTIDSSLMLKTTMPLNYELFSLVNGSVRVHVLCTDHVHSIRESFVVYITGMYVLLLVKKNVFFFCNVFVVSFNYDIFTFCLLHGIMIGSVGKFFVFWPQGPRFKLRLC